MIVQGFHFMPGSAGQVQGWDGIITTVRGFGMAEFDAVHHAVRT